MKSLRATGRTPLTAIRAAAPLSLLLLLWAPAGSAGLAEGQAALAAGNHARALSELQDPAQSGNAQAQYLLGLMYEDGLGVQQNSRAAMDWFQRAAAQGHDDAQMILGSALLFGWGMAPDTEAGLGWLQRAAAQGNSQARQLMDRHMRRLQLSGGGGEAAKADPPVKSAPVGGAAQVKRPAGSGRPGAVVAEEPLPATQPAVPPPAAAQASAYPARPEPAMARPIAARAGPVAEDAEQADVAERLQLAMAEPAATTPARAAAPNCPLPNPGQPLRERMAQPLNGALINWVRTDPAARDNYQAMRTAIEAVDFRLALSYLETMRGAQGESAELEGPLAEIESRIQAARGQLWDALLNAHFAAQHYFEQLLPADPRRVLLEARLVSLSSQACQRLVGARLEQVRKATGFLAAIDAQPMTKLDKVQRACSVLYTAVNRLPASVSAAMDCAANEDEAGLLADELIKAHHAALKLGPPMTGLALAYPKQRLPLDRQFRAIHLQALQRLQGQGVAAAQVYLRKIELALPEGSRFGGASQLALLLVRSRIAEAGGPNTGYSRLDSRQATAAIDALSRNVRSPREQDEIDALRRLNAAL